MEKISTLVMGAILTLCIAFIAPVMAENDNYGAAAAAQVPDEALTLEKMLNFALQDEYLARGEYQRIIEKFGNHRPFANIIRAEERHIAWLLPLFKKFSLTLPPDRGLELATIPATFAQGLQLGAKAEVANIAMYQRFLKQQLPEEVRVIFNYLLSGSQRHLAAFNRNNRATERKARPAE